MKAKFLGGAFLLVLGLCMVLPAQQIEKIGPVVRPQPKRVVTVFHGDKTFTADSETVSYGSFSVHFINRDNGLVTRVYGNFYVVEEDLKQ